MQQSASVMTPSGLHELSLISLDRLPPRELFKAVKSEVRALGVFRVELARHLDKLLGVKVARTLQKAIVADLGAVDELISQLCALVHKSSRSETNATPAPESYAMRWSALRDLISAAENLNEHANTVSEERTRNGTNTTWEHVAEVVLRAGSTGVSWSAIAESVVEWGKGPKTKGGISQIISAMRAAGWIDAKSEGQRKRLFPGRRIHECAAAVALAKLAEKQPHQPALKSRPLDSFDRPKPVVMLVGADLNDFDFPARMAARTLRSSAQPRPTVH